MIKLDHHNNDNNNNGDNNGTGINANNGNYDCSNHHNQNTNTLARTTVITTGKVTLKPESSPQNSSFDNVITAIIDLMRRNKK